MKKVKNWFLNPFKRKKVKLPTQNTSEKLAENEVYEKIERLLLHSNRQTFINLWTYRSSLTYWCCFFTAVVYCESGYDRFKRFLEPAPLNYESLGLMQLSYIDQNWHTFCDIQGEKIFEVGNNLMCGMQIMDKLMKLYKKPFFNQGHYWSVLQPRREIHKKFLAKFNSLLTEKGY